MGLTPRRHLPDDPGLADILALIQTSFAFMDGRIDPPSSMHRLTPDSLSRQAETGEIWSLGTPVRACVFLTPKPGHLYVGKLAVAAEARGRGLARHLLDHAASRATALRLPCLVLQTRVELTENHRFFERLGFRETGRTAHPGHDRPTSITYTRQITDPASP